MILLCLDPLTRTLGSFNVGYEIGFKTILKMSWMFGFSICEAPRFERSLLDAAVVDCVSVL